MNVPRENFLTGEFTETKQRSRNVLYAIYGAVVIVCINLCDLMHHVTTEKHLFQSLAIVNMAGIAAVTFLFTLWMYRALNNLTNIGVRRLTVSREMTPYWWAFPLANLVLPFFMLRDVIKHSVSALGGEEKKPGQYMHVTLSWLCFTIGSTLYMVSSLSAGKDDDTTPQLIACIFLLAGTFLAIAAMEKIRLWEAELFERVEKRAEEEELEPGVSLPGT